MTVQNKDKTDSSLTTFTEILSDEFTAKTGFGVYAHITPTDVNRAYQEYQLSNVPMRLFAQKYVRPYVYSRQGTTCAQQILSNAAGWRC